MFPCFASSTFASTSDTTSVGPDFRIYKSELLIFVVAALCLSNNVSAQTRTDLNIENRLWQRVLARPDDSSRWRILGRAQFKRGAFEEAFDAFERAVTLDPLSVAANYDMGRIYVERAQPRNAAFHFRRSIELAPDSEYAKRAGDFLEEFGPSESFVEAGYEIRRFDGSEFSGTRELVNETIASEGTSRLYDLRIEAGVLYNSNVALTPLSRELSPAEPASPQVFISPDLQLSLIDRRTWRTGTTFRGHFNVNGGDFREFNLQSYRPGLFIESFHFVGGKIFVPRVAYDFTHDEFDGETFGNRHALAASFTASWNDTHSSFLYWSIDYTDIQNDGILPSVTSQDGWTNMVGLSHDTLLNHKCFKLFRAGVDWTTADPRGSDFRFQGVSLFAEGVLTVATGTELSLQGGWGYRDYRDFEFTPSRNEIVWRAGVELRKRVREDFSVAIVFNYDRFASKNPLFDAERFVSGVVTTFEY